MAILSEDTMTGSVTIETEMQYICNYGYELSDLELYTSPVSSLNHELNRISEDEPRVIFGQQYLDDAILTLKTLEKLDFYPDALIADSVGYTRPGELKKAGADGNFVISRLGWALGLGKEKPLIYKVNDLYRERYGENMDETNARSFTGFLVLADAINRAGSTNHYDIRDALRNTFLPGEKLIMPWEGVKFDEHGQNILAEGILGQIQNNRFRIIWPKELAETHVIWPAPSWDER
jgi:branched-chain amino acid transport system substrate-binding protein